MNKKNTVLTDTEIATLKEARKILKRLTKKAIAWDDKLNKMPCAGKWNSKWDEECNKFDAWADALYKEAGVDMSGCECHLEVE